MINVFLCDPGHTTIGLFNNYVPLNIALIAEYGERKLKDYDLRIGISKSVTEILDIIRNKQVDVLGLSAYLWNTHLALFIAGEFKKDNPHGICVLGGPNFPKDRNLISAWLQNHSQIDFIVDGEGELAFANLLQAIIKSSYDYNFIRNSKVPGCIGLSEDHQLLYEDILPIGNMSDIPSPYLSGRLDKYLIQGTDGYKLLPLFENARGCPFRCTFCRSSVMSPTVRFFPTDRFLAEVEYVAKLFMDHRIEPCLMMMTDENFGQYIQDTQVASGMQKIKDRYGFPENIIVTTGKRNANNILKTIFSFSGLEMTLSVQSLDANVLKNVKRSNFPLDRFIEYQSRAKKNGKKTISQIIIGLPGDNKEKHLATIAQLLKADLDFINPFTFMLLPGTESESIYSRQKYKYVTRYRLIPGGFSEYKKQKVFEIEEVVASTNTMNFEDYLYLRRMHLIVISIFNDDTFRAIRNLLNAKNIDLMEYLHVVIEMLEDPSCDQEIKTIVSHFLLKTQEELFEDKESLIRFYSENYELLRRGEIGENLLMKHRFLFYLKMDKFLPILIKAVVHIFNKNNYAITNSCISVFEYLTAQAQIITLLLKNRSWDNTNARNLYLSYDIISWLINPGSFLNEFKFLAPKHFVMNYSDNQIENFLKLLSHFGKHENDMAKILHRIGANEIIPECIPKSHIVLTQ